MNTVEWIATFFAIAVIIKFILMMVNPKGFIKWATNIYSKDNKVLKYLYLVLFFVLAFNSLQEITIVQLFVAMLAGMMLMGHTLLHYPKIMRTFIKQFKGKNSNTKIIFDWLIWILLSCLVLRQIFF